MNRFFNWLVFGPIITLIMVTLFPLLLAVVCYDFVATFGMTADEVRRYYAARFR
jgi:hypothetical protein